MSSATLGAFGDIQHSNWWITLVPSQTQNQRSLEKKKTLKWTCNEMQENVISNPQLNHAEESGTAMPISQIMSPIITISTMPPISTSVFFFYSKENCLGKKFEISSFLVSLDHRLILCRKWPNPLAPVMGCRNNSYHLRLILSCSFGMILHCQQSKCFLFKTHELLLSFPVSPLVP